jgi:hypothetical protein
MTSASGTVRRTLQQHPRRAWELQRAHQHYSQSCRLHEERCRCTPRPPWVRLQASFIHRDATLASSAMDSALGSSDFDQGNARAFPPCPHLLLPSPPFAQSENAGLKSLYRQPRRRLALWMCRSWATTHHRFSYAAPHRLPRTEALLLSVIATAACAFRVRLAGWAMPAVRHQRSTTCLSSTAPLVRTRTLAFGDWR